LAVSHISQIASNGPTKAPTVSRDWRKPKTCAAQMHGGDIGHEGVTRRAANALSDAVDETSRHQPTY